MQLGRLLIRKKIASSYQAGPVSPMETKLVKAGPPSPE